MITNIDKLTEHGCSGDNKDKVCRSRGGESCAFDGAMIVLQPIADAAHIVHGPIACCGNSWEGRGTLSSKHNLHRMGFTTDMNEMDIVYGSEEKLFKSIIQTSHSVKPKAIFVYATCVSGLTGENIESVCKRAEEKLGIRVIPVNAPGFVGPKNLGNRIAGEVLLDYVIGTGKPPSGNHNSPCPPLILRGGGEAGGVTLKDEFQGTVNLIGEYNIAGDLWFVGPLLKEAGLNILSRITGDSTFEEITYAHHAKLNVVVCSRALVNVAKEMDRRYGIPCIEVSFFGKTEMSKALRRIGARVRGQGAREDIEILIAREEKQLDERLKPYSHLKGKKAVLYTGGVKSWSFISALLDLGIEIVAVGTKKSTFEDEEKMKDILGEDAPLVEDVTPKNLLRLLKERNADVLVAGGRNQYLAIKEGFPFVDVNQERHVAYAGYEGLVNFAEQISNSMKFYKGVGDWGLGIGEDKNSQSVAFTNPRPPTPNPCLINPLKHSQSMGAAIALQGIDRALPIIHGAQGCTFLGKVLITKHFREPIALAGTKLFTEDVVLGSEEKLISTIDDFIKKNTPDVIGVLTSGLSEAKGDDVEGALKRGKGQGSRVKVIHVHTPDYEGGLETGYVKAVEAVLGAILTCPLPLASCPEHQINVLAGSHLTPADFTELREIIESFGLKPIILPDLSALDGSRQGFSALAVGGTTVDDIAAMSKSAFTLAIGASMEPPAKLLNEKFGIEYSVAESLSGLNDTDIFMRMLSFLSGNPLPVKYERQRKILIDGMRDAHFYLSGKKVCTALEPDLSIQTSRWLKEMAVDVELAVVPVNSGAAAMISAINIVAGDLHSINGDFDLLISNSHAEDTADRLGVPLYQMGFPVYKVMGYTSRTTIGYRGSLAMINEAANLLLRRHDHEQT
ncbi:MAG: nitrogenase iron-molybdenum cofactor biosynthesis protein NifE [Nitrospirae bacterium]|nr:nitrogenase iron-molybdenum cofactor biosynthesis protein NifE [Nitrospirota bacterium]